MLPSNIDSQQMPLAFSQKAILDLDLIVEKWTEYMWNNTSKGKQSLQFEELDMIVNWNKLEIAQDKVVFEVSDLNKKQSQKTLFRTYFTNKTDKEQEYSFLTERTTRQTCSFSFSKGFKSEKEASISFKLPYDIAEISAGLKREQSVELGKDKTYEEEITWGVDSNVKVAPFTKTTAELIISEVELEREFSVVTYLKGRISVTVNSKKDNNAFLKLFSTDISQLFGLAINRNWLKSGIKVNTLKDDSVKIECNGLCKFSLGIEQHIDLRDEPLNGLRASPSSSPKSRNYSNSEDDYYSRSSY